MFHNYWHGATSACRRSVASMTSDRSRLPALPEARSIALAGLDVHRADMRLDTYLLVRVWKQHSIPTDG
jgi:hypothetical protein